MAEEIVFNVDLDLNTGAKSLKSLKEEFKNTQKELDGLQAGSEKYVATLQKLGGIKDEIGDLNAEIKAFNPEGKVQAFSSVIGGVASGFQAATGAAALFGTENKDLEKTLVKVQAAMAFAEGIKGLVALGDGFKVLGNIIKAHPLYLIVGLVASIGAAMVALKDKIGFIGDAFDAVGKVIDGVVEHFKNLLDFIGLTNFAMDRLNQSILDNNKKTTDSINARYDSEIAAAQRAHKETVQLEIAKQQEILKTNNLAIEALERRRQAQGSLSEEDLQALTELRASNSEAYKAISDTWAAYKDAQIAKDKQFTEESRKQAEKRKEDELRIRKETIEIAKEQERVLAEFRLSLDAEEQARKDAKLTQLEADGDAETERILRQQAARAELALMESEANIFTKMEYLDQQYQMEIANTELTESEKLVIKKRYEDEKAALTAQAVQQELNIYAGLTSSLQSLSDSVFAIKRANLRKGSAEEEASARKQFNVNKALGIASATITGIQSVMAAYQSGLATPIIGPATGLAYAVIAGLTAAANIAKIASAKYQGGGGGSVASVSAVAAPSINPPTINAPQNSNTLLNPDGSVQNNNSQSQQPIKVFVTEDDIRKTGNRVNVLENQATIR